MIFSRENLIKHVSTIGDLRKVDLIAGVARKLRRLPLISATRLNWL